MNVEFESFKSVEDAETVASEVAFSMFKPLAGSNPKQQKNESRLVPNSTLGLDDLSNMLHTFKDKLKFVYQKLKNPIWK